MIRILPLSLILAFSSVFAKGDLYRDLRIFKPEATNHLHYRTDAKTDGYGVQLQGGETIKFQPKQEGKYAVYLSLVTPSPRLNATWGNRRFSLAPNARFYHGVKEPFPAKSTIRNGSVYAINPAKQGEFVSQEIFAGYGDFAEGPLIIENGQKQTRITRIRIRSLSPEDLALLEHENNPTKNRRVIYNNDGFSEGFGESDWTPQEIYRQIDRFKDSDCERLDYQTVSGGTVQFPSKYLEFYGEGIVNFAREFEKNAAANYRKLVDAGMPLYPTLVKRGAEIQLPVWGAQRMNAYYGDHPFGWSLNGAFWRENHEKFGIKDKSGRPFAGRGELSYAFPEIRQQKLGVLKELVEQGCEGVTLDFHTPHVLGYEEPMVAAFQKKFGQDPRRLPESDSRWQKVRCEVMTNFLREVRTELNEVGKTLGKKIGVCIRLPANSPRRYGYDPETWIKERLVDMLVPGEAFGNMEIWYDIKPWVEMTKGSDVKIYGNIEYFIDESSHTELTDEEVESGVQPGVQTIYTKEDYLHRAAELYRDGADGLYLYNNFMREPEQHISLNQLGDKEYVRKWSLFQDPRNLGSEIISIIP